MMPNQRKHFYAQRFHSRLGPLTSNLAHVRIPKAAPFPSAPLYSNANYTPSFQPVFRESQSRSSQWEDDELSASTFRARALERMRDEPRNSFAPSKFNPIADRRAQAQPVRQVESRAPPARTVSAPSGGAGPLAVINAPLTSLDVLVGNSQLTVQPKQNLLRKAAYLLQENGLSDIYADGTVAFASTTTVCATELVLEITGSLGNFAEYCGLASDSKFVSFYAGANAILGHVTCWADYLMHGTLESYEFGEHQVHLFRLPLGHEPSQGILLRDKAKLRVALQNLNLAPMQQGGLRHRFFVRYYEEK